MGAWAAIVAYVVAYDAIVIRANRRRTARGLVIKRQTLSGYARRLDERPALRAAAIGGSILLTNHLFGTRRPI